jgi:hypothetical protein
MISSRILVTSKNYCVSVLQVRSRQALFLFKNAPFAYLFNTLIKGKRGVRENGNN